MEKETWWEKRMHNASVEKKRRIREAPLTVSLHPSLFFHHPLQTHPLFLSGSHSLLLSPPPHTSLFFFTPPSPLLPPFHPPPFPTSAPHPISGLPLNKSWRDNSTIVARVWEPWTETIAVYPSSGTAWTLSFITAGPSLIKSVPQVPQ